MCIFLNILQSIQYIFFKKNRNSMTCTYLAAFLCTLFLWTSANNLKNCRMEFNAVFNYTIYYGTNV